MSLIKCKECGNDISDKAITCPKCGAPAEKQVQEEKDTTYEHRDSYSPKLQEEKKSSFKTIGLILSLGIVAVIAIAFYNNPNSIPGFSVKINTPKPVIATSRGDDANATLLNFKETIYATISNQGGNGNVLVNFHLQQGGKTYIRTKSVYLSAGQNTDVSEIFDEVTRLGGKMTYSVDASAQ